MTVAEARRGLDDRTIDPFDLVSDCLARIDRTEETLRAWITVDGDRALERAAQMRGEEPAGPLWGIPFGIKDIIDVAGLATTAGSKLLAGNVAQTDAPVVRSLREAGAIILGKTNTHEFAYGCTTPPTANPWDLKRIPGGSSGGSAVAVAASGCLAALGSDTAGSIRIPSALCGVSGLKPRPNIISIDGVVPLAPSFDALGPIARTVEDLVLIWAGLADHNLGLDLARIASRSLPNGGFRLALPYPGMLPDIDSEVENAYSAAVGVLKSLAVSTNEAGRASPKLDELDRPRSLVLMIEALEVHRSRGWWPQHERDYTEETRSYLDYASRTFSSSDYEPSLSLCRELGARFCSFLDTADVLATPALPRPAPTHEEAVRVDEKSPRRPMVLELTRIPAIANVAHLAALSVPCGFTSRGLPIGLQLMGKDELLLLEVGMAYQRETDWHTRRPPLAAG